MRGRLAGVAVAIAVVVATSAPTASAALRFCQGDEAGCGSVEVPLDRSGVVPGTVRLHVEVTPAVSSGAPPLLTIGGSPGQAGTRRFDVNTLDAEGRDMVSMDLRGTGASGQLRCDPLQRTGLYRSAAAARACADSLGPRRAFYTARDSAMDVEAVRQALGASRIAILGVAWGARVAAEYARLHPDQVERLVLVSPPPPGGIDPLYRSSLAAVPGIVRRRCAHGACRRASPSPVADVSELARRLERSAIEGPVIDGFGRPRRVRLESFDLFQLLRTGEESHLPAYVRAAVRGDVAPLLRELDRQASYRGSLATPEVAKRFSLATYAAAVCEESQFPWPREASPADRGAYLSSFAATPIAFGPFGSRTASQSDVVDLCREWPAASPPPAPFAVSASIPSLVIASAGDIEAPMADARAVAAAIPGSQLLELVNGGGDCAIERFLAGSTPLSCRRRVYGPDSVDRVSPPPPRSLAEIRAGPRRDRAQRTLVATRLTLEDGASAVTLGFFAKYLLMPEGGERRLAQQTIRAGALRSGSYRLGVRGGRFVLARASYIPGVRVTGSVAPARGRDGEPEMRGTLIVSGPAAARGRLILRGERVHGRLGGRVVRLHLDETAYPDITVGR